MCLWITLNASIVRSNAKHAHESKQLQAFHLFELSAVLESAAIHTQRQHLMTKKNTTTPNERLDDELENLLNSLGDDSEESKPAACAEIRTPVTEPISIQEPVKTSFPKTQKERLSKSSDEALHLLAQACHELARHGDYATVRERICQLQIELNEYGLLAPSFRPRPKKSRPKGSGSKKLFTETDMAIHRDLIVIDCHWLYARKVKVRVDSGDMLYQPLFNLSKLFDFELAWTFANENWRNDTRVESALRLPKLLQYQLAALRCSDIAKDLERLTVGTRKGGRLLPSPLARVCVALQEWCDDDPRVESQFEAYEAIYQAYWLLGPSAKTTALTELAALISGKEALNPRTLQGKLDKLLERMGDECAATGPSSEKFS